MSVPYRSTIDLVPTKPTEYRSGLIYCARVQDVRTFINNAAYADEEEEELEESADSKELLVDIDLDLTAQVVFSVNLIF